MYIDQNKINGFTLSLNLDTEFYKFNKSVTQEIKTTQPIVVYQLAGCIGV